MNENFRRYVEAAKQVAQAKGLGWHVHADNGKVVRENAWNLTEMSSAVGPPVYRLTDLSMDQGCLDALSAAEATGNDCTDGENALSSNWIELIKAVVVDQIYIRSNTARHTLFNIVRPLRVLATCSPNVEPWCLTKDNAEHAISIAAQIQPSGKLCELVESVVRRIIDDHHLADRSPLLLASEWRQGRVSGSRNRKKPKAFRNTEQARKNLSDRRNAARLPDERAFWELVRIVFTEDPKTFSDVLRFAQLKILLMCGLRVGEACTIPADWCGELNYLAADGRPAGEHGGFSRTRLLKYFSEKAGESDKDGVLYYPNAQEILDIFEEPLVSTLDDIKRLTQPLRDRLRRQRETGRLLPEFELDQDVAIVELLPRLTGNPFVFEDTSKDELLAKYRQSYDTAVLDEIECRQKALRQSGRIDNDVRVYLPRLRRGKEALLPCRLPDGSTQPRLDYQRGAFRISELEQFLRINMPTKMPDLGEFRTTGSASVHTDELLFLGPKRALSEARNGNICDVRRYFSVGRITSDEMIICLGGNGNSGSTIFQRYGETAADRDLTLNSHALRHLQNTELFRLGIADTIITKRYGRRSVAQSHEYDHRTLAEELTAVTIPPEAQDKMPEKAQQVLRLIESGKVRGKLVDEFRNIQREKGDDEAFDFLAVEADGFHTTPYGFCINSFTVDPCPKHLECFNGCRHLAKTDLPSHHENAIRLHGRLERAVREIEARPSTSLGHANQLQHAQVRLHNVKVFLDTEPGEQPFSGGQDLSSPVNKKVEFDAK